jgi:hypothetical protein
LALLGLKKVVQKGPANVFFTSIYLFLHQTSRINFTKGYVRKSFQEKVIHQR